MKRKRADGYPGKGMFARVPVLRRAEVDGELCTGCGSCYEACAHGRIKIDRRGKARIKRGCMGCGACASRCTSGAITMVDCR